MKMLLIITCFTIFRDWKKTIVIFFRFFCYIYPNIFYCAGKTFRNKIIKNLLVFLCLQHQYFYVTDGNLMHLTDASRFLISCVIQHYAPVMGWGRWRNRCIMFIMTLDLSWRQTLRLPSLGIEPASPASQAGTLPNELSRQLIPVFRIRDFLSQILDPDF